MEDVDELDVNLAPFLAALIMEAGGEVTISYDSLMKSNQSNTYIAMEMNQEGTIMTLSLQNESEVPEDARR